MLASLLDEYTLMGRTEAEINQLLGPPDHRDLRSSGDQAYWLGRMRGFIPDNAAWLILRYDDSRRVERVELEGTD